MHLSHLSHRGFRVRPLLVVLDSGRHLKEALCVRPQEPGVGVDTYYACAMTSPGHVPQCLQEHLHVTGIGHLLRNRGRRPRMHVCPRHPDARELRSVSLDKTLPSVNCRMASHISMQ